MSVPLRRRDRRGWGRPRRPLRCMSALRGSLRRILRIRRRRRRHQCTLGCSRPHTDLRCRSRLRHTRRSSACRRTHRRGLRMLRRHTRSLAHSSERRRRPGRSRPLRRPHHRRARSMRRSPGRCRRVGRGWSDRVPHHRCILRRCRNSRSSGCRRRARRRRRPLRTRWLRCTLCLRRIRGAAGCRCRSWCSSQGSAHSPAHLHTSLWR